VLGRKHAGEAPKGAEKKLQVLAVSGNGTPPTTNIMAKAKC